MRINFIFHLFKYFKMIKKKIIIILLNYTIIIPIYLLTINNNLENE
jgi:hypothetical protein